MTETTVAVAKSAVAVDATPSVAVNVTLDNFCVALSARDHRPHMIGAFHHAQRVAKKVFDTPANYQARYDEFGNLPA